MYTKGEWYWEYNDQMHHNLRAKSTHPSGVEEDKHILFVATDFLGEDSLINDDNAHLIAAAPDMYEALEAICLEHNSWVFEELAEVLGNTNTRILKDTIEKGKQALTKAKPE